MSFVRKWMRVFAFAAAVSVTAWGVGCSQQAQSPQTGASSDRTNEGEAASGVTDGAPEAGSATGGGGIDTP